MKSQKNKFSQTPPELLQFQEFLFSKSSEKAKDYLVFPLFKKIFNGKFKKESDAYGADLYIEGRLIVELKSDPENFLPGFYQCLHYEKKGLSFSSVCVIAHKFIGLWKIKDIPKEILSIAKKSDPLKPASAVGVTNARLTNRALKQELIKKAHFLLTKTEIEGIFEQDSVVKLIEFVSVLKNLEADRIQISRHNFINIIELLREFFSNPIEAIHCFYAVVGYWNATSKVSINDETETLTIFDYIRDKHSEPIFIKPRLRSKFKKFIEKYYVFTNEGSGLTVDYYFSRFDEVISKIKPEYAAQHGIFFTDHNLSKFALWFVHAYFEKKLSDKYIVLDPAGGSGNLVTSWKGHLKHKIVSELQPDLLRTIERRMKLDSDEVQAGFTIIPKTTENRGLNFIDKSAEEYIHNLLTELNEKGLKLDKPMAFLLNPPYKNTDENEIHRENADAAYKIHDSIIDLTGNDAAKERYLAFLAQILNIAKLQMGHLERETLTFDEFKVPTPLAKSIKETPLLLIFTPTSWLIPRPSYINFRNEFDKYFRFEMGFIFLGNEFFKIKGRFPISFTIWSYNFKKTGNKNLVRVKDLTHLKRSDLETNWLASWGDLDRDLKSYISKSNFVRLDNFRGDIRNALPPIQYGDNMANNQPMYDIKRDPTQEEINSGKIYGGLPSGDPRRANKKTYGTHNSIYLGLMDDLTPVRIKPDKYGRLSNLPDRVWFRLDTAFADINKSICVNLPTPVKSYCAYDLQSAKVTFMWFAIAKALNGRYPIWANQHDLWLPDQLNNISDYFFSLCFAFGLAENRAIITKFEKDNPTDGNLEIFVDNPLCPTNPESFWCSTLEKYIIKKPSLAYELVLLIKDLYLLWNKNYCGGDVLYGVGLNDEPYFKYFDYEDFVTPHSGIIQIKKYADIHGEFPLMKIIDEINFKARDVKNEIYGLLINDYKYFS